MEQPQTNTIKSFNEILIFDHEDTNQLRSLVNTVIINYTVRVSGFHCYCNISAM